MKPESKIRKLQRELKHWKTLALSVEWVQPTYNGAPSCPYCSHMEHWGHDSDCPIPKDLRTRLDRIEDLPDND